MPFVHAFSVVIPIVVARRQIEPDDARPGVRQNLGANGPTQFGKIGFRASFARNQDQVCRIDCANPCERELGGVAAPDPYERKRQHAAAIDPLQ
jgi:hypothetical protein